MQHISQHVRVSPTVSERHIKIPKTDGDRKAAPRHPKPTWWWRCFSDDDRKWKRKWLHEDPRSVTYDGFGSLKSGRNQALCWKAETVPTCQHSPSSQIPSDILHCFTRWCRITIYNTHIYLLLRQVVINIQKEDSGLSTTLILFSIPRAWNDSLSAFKYSVLKVPKL